MATHTSAGLLARVGDVVAMLETAVDWLDRGGSAELLDSLSPTDASSLVLRHVVEQSPSAYRAGLEFLMLGDRVPMSALPEELVRFACESDGVLVRIDEDSAACMTPFSFYRAVGMWYLAQTPHAWSTVYFGDDSLALAARIPAGRGQALDLCAGPGIQSLVLASRGWATTGVELNAVASWVSRINARMNRLEDRCQFVVGDLYQGFDLGQQFDYICANPPLLPIPAGVGYPFVGDGGPDGLAVTRQILRGAPRHLAPGGVLSTIGMTVSDGYLPLPIEELTSFAAENDIRLTMIGLQHYPADAASWWCRGVAETILAREPSCSPDDIDALAGEIADGYQQTGASHVMTYTLTARPGECATIYRDISDVARGMWFA